MMHGTAIIWLRRDLRLDDHFAFHKAQEIGAKILPVFIFDSEMLKNFQDKRDRRISFLYDRLRFLNDQLQKYDAKIEVFLWQSYRCYRVFVVVFKANVSDSWCWL